jgi:hypothetical protein
MRSSPAPVSMLGLGSGNQRAVGALIELHEHEVPDLDEPLGTAERRTTIGAIGRAFVPEYFRARPARTGVGHAPVVVLIEPLDALGGYADHVAPDGRGVVVADVHGDPQAVGIQPERLRDELPRVGNRPLFEVIAEAEVAEHLEERQVA